MDLKTIPMFAALRSSMSWLDRRQKVLAENISNASIPGYRAKDLEELDFSQTLAAVSDAQNRTFRNWAKKPAGVGFEVGPAARPFGTSSFNSTTNIRVVDAPGSETSPDGNSVVLEEQMMKVAETQMQFEAAASLYQKGLNLLRIASRSQ